MSTTKEDFPFSKFEQKKIIAMKSRKQNTLVAKTYNVVDFLFDIAYGIAISPVKNVSRNPGFESCQGIYSTD